MDVTNGSSIDILVSTLALLGLKNEKTTIIDCCSRENELVYGLLNHFVEVVSNDINEECSSQTHFDITQLDFWKSIHKKYDGIITQPPTGLLEILMLRAIEHCKSFCAFLVTPEQLNTLSTLLMHRPASVVIYLGTDLAWILWDINNMNRQASIEFTIEELALRETDYEQFATQVEEKIRTALNIAPDSQQNPQHELLYLKGVHAAKQGKALERAIDKYKGMYSKKDVITKVCKMKYRSAQRKLRIAKYIERFPEIASMTQRQAERYISEKLKKSRS